MTKGTFHNIDETIVAPDSDEALNCEADVTVFATPDGVGQRGAAAELAKGRKVLDYSGDFRFNSLELFAEYARRLKKDPAHQSPDLLPQSVYGLTELHREEIARARLVGNPGCFAMSCILGLAPAAKARWLAPRVRVPGPLDSLYGTVRGFLSVVQLNPFPAGECAPPPDKPGRVWVPSLTLTACPPRGAPTLISHLEGRVPALPTPVFLPRNSQSITFLSDLGEAPVPL